MNVVIGGTGIRISTSDAAFEEVLQVLGNGKRSAFNGGNPFACLGEAEIDGRRNRHIGRAVRLTQQFVVDQNAAIFCCYEVGATPGGKLDLTRTANYFPSNSTDSFGFGNLFFAELRHPYLLHSFRLKGSNILFPDEVPPGHQSLPPGRKIAETRMRPADSCVSILCAFILPSAYF
jgi:hypothetical protein